MPSNRHQDAGERPGGHVEVGAPDEPKTALRRALTAMAVIAFGVVIVGTVLITAPTLVAAVIAFSYIAAVAWLFTLELRVIALSESSRLTDEAYDLADRALAAVQAVINHLAETEPTGRHALAPAVAMTKEQLL